MKRRRAMRVDEPADGGEIRFLLRTRAVVATSGARSFSCLTRRYLLGSCTDKVVVSKPVEREDETRCPRHVIRACACHGAWAYGRRESAVESTGEQAYVATIRGAVSATATARIETINAAYIRLVYLSDTVPRARPRSARIDQARSSARADQKASATSRRC